MIGRSGRFYRVNSRHNICGEIDVTYDLGDGFAQDDVAPRVKPNYLWKRDHSLGKRYRCRRTICVPIGRHDERIEVFTTADKGAYSRAIGRNFTDRTVVEVRDIHGPVWSHGDAIG